MSRKIKSELFSFQRVLRRRNSPMKPQVIYLIRHGESVGNVNGEIYKIVPDYRVGLTEKGRKQAIQAGKNIAKDALSRYIKNYKPEVMVYSSPWARARETTKGIINGMGQMGHRFKILRSYEDPRLREQEWGNYQETDLQQKIDRERKAFGTFFYRMPHGESGADVYDRVTTFIDTLYRDFDRHRSDLCVIVTHGLTLKAFLTRWFHWSHEQFDWYKNPHNCEIFKMVLNQQSNKYVLETPMRLRPGAKA
jgi:broad specificity phosphatase PhoE